ncbi:MAG TPA: hypothetical protein VLA89_06135, partial [Gemmatimonadales bacterium]|nr:hypothetical protein [Gemmatimonadales bacterium]
TGHRRTHMPVAEDRGNFTQFHPARRPIRQYRTHDHRYDEHFPRGEGRYRFRIYRLRGGELQMIGAAPTAGDFGEALFRFHEEGEFIADDATGVLDTLPEPGDWIVHPFALGRRRSEES